MKRKGETTQTGERTGANSQGGIEHDLRSVWLAGEDEREYRI